MLKPKQNVFHAKAQQSLDKGTVVIDAGSLVYDNQWISYQGTTFSARRYIGSVIDGTTRRRFFNDRNYAVQLILGVDKAGAIQVREGVQVAYTTKQSVPVPAAFDVVPLVSILLVQDGSSDMNYGFKPLNDTNVTYFSGAGNVIDKNQRGEASTYKGITGSPGVQGITGLRGVGGLTGQEGEIGVTGSQGWAETGIQGIQGMTGINWAIHIPFEVFF